ncbi:MAG: nucleotide exchange factor GrpE [Bacteroidales bacterium]|nr:nucleotide exchange factor GrpE [Bacteroidales bacterium]
MEEKDINREMEDPKDQTNGQVAEQTAEKTAEKAGEEVCGNAQDEEGQCSEKRSRRARKAAEQAEKIADLEAKLAKEKDDYLRLMAEFDNFRRRTAQDRLDLISNASADVIKGLLPVLDDFERAVKALEGSTDSDAAKEGTRLIYTKLMDFLKTKGLAVIEAVGKDFETDLFEAVAQFPVEEAEKKGKVFDVVQTGYTLNGKVLRFAKVVVGI